MSDLRDATPLPSSSAIVESVRISRAARDQLITLKRRTNIENWNVLCRWALCVSLAEPTRPREVEVATDGAIEMTWRTFGGANEEVFAALIRERCQRDGVPVNAETLARHFRLHLHRGIAYLVGNRKLSDLPSLISAAAKTPDAIVN